LNRLPVTGRGCHLQEDCWFSSGRLESSTTAGKDLSQKQRSFAKMTKVTRRAALGLASTFAIASASPKPSAALAKTDDKDSENKVLIAVDLPNLGELYKACDLKFANETDDPAEDLIIKSLKACAVRIIDQKVQQANGEWKFTFANGFPMIAVNGPLNHQLKDKKGRPFKFSFVKAYPIGLANSVKRPNEIAISVNMFFHVERNSAIFISTALFGMTPEPRFVYDVEGNRKSS
jgi:hypothetical protein